MTNVIKKSILVLALIGLIGVIVSFYFVNIATGSAPSGLPAILKIATTTVVGPQSNTELFPANPMCASRVISTVNQEITLIFADPSNGDVSSTTLSSIVGHVQSASTTNAYDSGIYGCGRMFGHASASTTITIAEFR